MIAGEITSTVKALSELCVRIDERVKSLVLDQAENASQFDDVREEVSKLSSDMRHDINDISQRIAVLETKTSKLVSAAKQNKESIEQNTERNREIVTRLAALEGSSKTQEGRWKVIFDFIWKTIWVLFVAYLLWRLNLQDVAIP